jgi:hypothetical protein
MAEMSMSADCNAVVGAECGLEEAVAQLNVVKGRVAPDHLMIAEPVHVRC